MGTWLYAYLTKRPVEGALDGGKALLALQLGGEGLQLQPTATEMLADEEGHCDAVGRKFKLRPDPASKALAILNEDFDALFTFGGRDLFFSFSTKLRGGLPHITLGWSVRLFEKLSEERKLRYCDLICRAAEAAGATSALISIEPPDYFEDHIVYIDDSLLVDCRGPGGSPVDMIEVWVRDEVNLIADGMDFVSRGGIGIYRRYVGRFGSLGETSFFTE